LASEYARAVPILRQAAAVLRGGPVSREDITHWFHVGIFVANELWDDQTYSAWGTRVEKDAREHGALIALQFILLGLAKHETRAGRFANAGACYAESVDIPRAIGGPVEFYELVGVDLSAWRGDEVATRRDAPKLSGLGAAIGSAQTVHLAELALATLALGYGRYDEALTSALRLTDEHAPGWTCQALHVAIEAGVRSGERSIAEDCLQRLADRATVTQTDWALGQLARSRALLAPDDTAEALYEQAIMHLAQTSVATELAQAHLDYGEWLRRQNRRVDAREQLRTAYEQFHTMGALAFAARARTELTATGERARKRTVDTTNELTPQERRIAALAASGATNPEIGAQLFITANTVDYHLRKIFRKLQITSRRQLRRHEQVLRS
jgi:DNA-binding CsgD family transcriptional regulator